MNIRIENGDIVFDGTGRLKWVENEEHKIQSIILRLKTLLENLFYDDSYGLALFRMKERQDIVEDYLRNCIMQDEDVDHVEFISIERVQPGHIAVEANIYLIEGYNITLDTQIPMI